MKRFLRSLLVLTLSANLSAAAEPAASSSPVKLTEVSFKTEPTVRLPVERAILVGVSNRYSLIVPSGMRAIANPEAASLTLTSADQSSALILNLLKPGPEEGQSDASGVAALAARRFPDWIPAEAGSINIDGQDAVVVPLTQKGSLGLARRFVRCVVSGTVIECVFTFPEKRETELLPLLYSVLGSFRVSPLEGPLRKLEYDSEI